MKSRGKGLHYGIILFVLINIIIGLSGNVHAAQQKREAPESPDTTGEPGADKELKPDTDESEFSTLVLNNDFTPLEEDLLKCLCMVKWRNADNLVNHEQDASGWYDTIGTLISDVAIIAAPSANLRAQRHTAGKEWYVKTVTIGLHGSEVRKVFKKDDLTVYFHERFGDSRDSSHRFALIILKTPMDSGLLENTMRPKLVGYPLVPRKEDETTVTYDDYSVTQCKIIVMTLDQQTKKMDFKQVPVIATRCTWNENQTSNPAYNDRLCVFVKIPFAPAELMYDRMFYPQDMGAPLFCNGLLTGLYAGVQNLNGNFYANEHERMASVEQAQYGGHLMTPEDQYVFEIPGSSANWKFISGITSKEEHLSWVNTMKVLEDDNCPAAPYPPRTYVDLNTRPPHGPDDEMTDDGESSSEEAPGPSGEAPRPVKKTDLGKSGAPRVARLAPALAAAALGALALV